MDNILTKRETSEPASSVQSHSLNSKPQKSYSRRHVDQNGCWCAKSKCLKLYCACFAKGKYCSTECKCQSCHNLTGNKVSVLLFLEADGRFRLFGLRLSCLFLVA